jgi:hypothetical protein
MLFVYTLRPVKCNCPGRKNEICLILPTPTKGEVKNFLRTIDFGLKGYNEKMIGARHGPSVCFIVTRMDNQIQLSLVCRAYLRLQPTGLYQV